MTATYKRMIAWAGASLFFLTTPLLLAEDHGCEEPTAKQHVSNEKRKNLLAGADQQISHTEKGTPPTWQNRVTFEKDGRYPVQFRALFEIDDPSGLTTLKLQKPVSIKTMTLNGQKILLPISRMEYHVVPNIPASLLKKGTNELLATWGQRVREHTDKKTSEVSLTPDHIDVETLEFRLFEVKPEELTFQTEPVLGYAGPDFFTVTCRVNLSAKVTLHVNGKKYVSEPALLHSFRVEGLTADTAYPYSMEARLDKKTIITTGPHSVRTLPTEDPFTFAILGDSRTHPKDWETVAASLLTHHPIFSVFVGDMVSNGWVDSQWDDEFCTPAKEFLATIPFYGVMGNHEGNCPLFPKIFATPSEKNWSQEIGSVLIIGMDGNMDWSQESTQTQWLEKLLSESQAKFIFLSSHWPAWTSGYHGRHGPDNRPKEKPIRQGQDVIMPLLKKYQATAMFAGHDHIYERSEPTNGVTMVVTGGAGAPRSGQMEGFEERNPHSVLFASTLHYCLLSVDGDLCTMKVLSPEGELIDTRSWSSRIK